MEIIRFTKFWAPLSIEQLGARAAALGYDGLDLVVREGYAINPANLTDALPRALARLGTFVPSHHCRNVTY